MSRRNLDSIEIGLVAFGTEQCPLPSVLGRLIRNQEIASLMPSARVFLGFGPVTTLSGIYADAYRLPSGQVVTESEIVSDLKSSPDTAMVYLFPARMTTNLFGEFESVLERTRTTTPRAILGIMGGTLESGGEVALAIKESLEKVRGELSFAGEINFREAIRYPERYLAKIRELISSG